MDSLVLQTAIGLVFVFAAGAAAVSIITESISRYIGLRSEYLLRGLRTLLDGGGDFELPLWTTLRGKAGPAKHPSTPRPTVAATPVHSVGTPPVQGRADAPVAPVAEPAEPTEPAPGTATDRRAMVAKIMAHPLVGATAKPGDDSILNPGDAPLSNKQRRRLPSYLSARSFAAALIDLVVPDANGGTSMDAVREMIRRNTEMPPRLRDALLAVADQTTGGIEAFRTNVEHWYDDQMARVSGWYKRHVRWISLAIGIAIVLVFNLDTLAIARSLYTDEAVRGAVVTQASQASTCEKPTTPAQCLQQLRKEIADVRGAGLPIGWVTVPECAAVTSCSWIEARGLWVRGGRPVTEVSHLVVLLLGWIIMVVALIPGANFWFDILGKLGTLRNSGPKPTST